MDRVLLAGGWPGLSKSSKFSVIFRVIRNRTSRVGLTRILSSRAGKRFINIFPLARVIRMNTILADHDGNWIA